MRIVGLDLGSKTIGIAISDPLGIIATGVETYRFNENDYDAAFQRVKEVVNDLNAALNCVKQIIEENKIEKIVLGLPKNMDGTIGFQAQYCLDFKKMLEEETNLPVIMIDERLTSKIANNTMIKADMNAKKRKKHVDKLAASIILQTYLDSNKRF